MSDFVRKFENLGALKSNEDFFVPLEKDIQAGAVFPAIRNREAHFYYRGYRLFTFNKGFQTNDSFVSDRYNVVKEKIDSHITDKCREEKERPTLSKLYSMCAPRADCNYILIDIEAGIPSVKNETESITNTQIDLVFLSRQGEIVFVEAKDFSDGRVSQKMNGTIEVDRQLEKYTKLIFYYEHDFLYQYKNQLSFLFNFFDMNGFVAPTKVNKQPRLLIYNYNSIVETDQHGKYVQKKAGIEYLIKKYGTKSIILIENIGEFSLDRHL